MGTSSLSAKQSASLNDNIMVYLIYIYFLNKQYYAVQFVLCEFLQQPVNNSQVCEECEGITVKLFVCS